MISLNSWMIPRLIIQGYEPAEVIFGGPADLERLENALEKLYSGRRRRSDSLIPRVAAVGYFTYEGAFRFGIYRNLTALEPLGFHPFWQRKLKTWKPTSPTKRMPFTHVDPVIGWFAEQNQAQFEQMVTRAKGHIAQGNLSQVKLSQKFFKTFTGNPYHFFGHMLVCAHSPGCAFMDLGDHQVLSNSPELFIKIQGRHVTSRPIRGTRSRESSPVNFREIADALLTGRYHHEDEQKRKTARDEEISNLLLNDPRELADLARITEAKVEEFGQFCEPPSIEVTRTAAISRFTQVMHLGSTIQGDLAQGVTPLNAVLASLPGVSTIGTPKARAREVIKELEPSPRGLYSGILGYFDEDGDAAFTTAVRTMILHQNQLSLAVGAWINSDTDPKSAFEETLLKAKGAHESLQSYLDEQKEKGPGYCG